MCLETITKRSRSQVEVTAYQVFRQRKTGGKFRLHALYINNTLPVKIGVWEVALNQKGRPKERIKLGNGYSSRVKSYPPGFHCYPSESSAAAKVLHRRQLDWRGDLYVVRTVRIRKVHTKGWQEDREVWVASERKILPLRKKKGN